MPPRCGLVLWVPYTRFGSVVFYSLRILYLPTTTTGRCCCMPAALHFCYAHTPHAYPALPTTYLPLPPPPAACLRFGSFYLPHHTFRACLYYARSTSPRFTRFPPHAFYAAATATTYRAHTACATTTCRVAAHHRFCCGLLLPHFYLPPPPAPRLWFAYTAFRAPLPYLPHTTPAPLGYSPAVILHTTHSSHTPTRLVYTLHHRYLYLPPHCGLLGSFNTFTACWVLLPAFTTHAHICCYTHTTLSLPAAHLVHTLHFTSFAFCHHPVQHYTTFLLPYLHLCTTHTFYLGRRAAPCAYHLPPVWLGWIILLRSGLYILVLDRLDGRDLPVRMCALFLVLPFYFYLLRSLVGLPHYYAVLFSRVYFFAHTYPLHTPHYHTRFLHTFFLYLPPLHFAATRSATTPHYRTVPLYHTHFHFIPIYIYHPHIIYHTTTWLVLVLTTAVTLRCAPPHRCCHHTAFTARTTHTAPHALPRAATAPAVPPGGYALCGFLLYRWWRTFFLLVWDSAATRTTYTHLLRLRFSRFCRRRAALRSGFVPALPSTPPLPATRSS